MSILKSQLRTLVALQKAEIEISVTEKDLAGTDDRINALTNELSKYQVRFVDHEQQLTDLRKQYRADENEVEMIEAQILKSKEKLGAVKTNKEYQSMLKEIDELTLKSSQLQDKILENLDHIETSELALVELKDDLTDITSEVAQKQEEIRNHSKNQRNEMKTLVHKRNTIWDAIDAGVKDTYQIVKRQGQGIAMAEIVDSVCQVCRMNIPAQLFHELLRLDQMRMCPNCQRIMYPKVILDDV